MDNVLMRAVTQTNVHESIRLSRAGDLLYLCNYKSACTTLLLCMARRERELGLIDLEPDADSVHVDDILSFQNFPLTDPRPFTFSFVRNPYARALSAYLDKIHAGTGKKLARAAFCIQYKLDPGIDISFREFLHCVRSSTACELDPHWRTQAHNLLLGGLIIDFLGHVETFDEDASALVTLTGLKIDSASVEAGRRHETSAGLRLDQFYGDTEISLVNEIYEEDFQAFEYGFDPGNLAPNRRELQFEITDPALHNFIAGIGLRRLDVRSALDKLRVAQQMAPDSTEIARCLESIRGRLKQSIAKRETDATETLPASGQDANALIGGDRMRLFDAAWNGQRDVVEMLVREGANPNTVTDTETTALMAAATNGHPDIARYLASHGGHIDARDRNGTTALMVAAWNGHRSVVDVLLSFAADANLVRADGRTAVMMATMGGHSEIVDALARNGSDVNAKNAIGNTPLMIAAWSGNRDLVELLISLGAEVGARRNDGQTAHDLARMGKHPDIVAILASTTSVGSEKLH
jgi:ankyrin repeat protein